MKLALSGCFALLVAGAVQASSCIISGSTDRACTASADSTALVDVRSGGVLSGSFAATAEDPFECREMTFGLSNMLAIFDCTKPPCMVIIFK